MPHPSKYDDWIPKDTRFNDGRFLSEPGGVYQPNAWGLLDMHGNVAEWTLSAYRPYPYHADEGREDIAGHERRVVRGGSWRDRPSRSAARSGWDIGPIRQSIMWDFEWYAKPARKTDQRQAVPPRPTNVIQQARGDFTMSQSVSRRRFLEVGAGTSLAAYAAVAAANPSSSANETIVVGVMGVNGRGRALSLGFADRPGVEVAYVCDVDSRATKRAAGAVAEKTSKAPAVVSDFRRILDDPQVDMLAVATPNHWHCASHDPGLQCRQACVLREALQLLTAGRGVVRAGSSPE